MRVKASRALPTVYGALGGALRAVVDHGHGAVGDLADVAHQRGDAVGGA